MRELAIKLRSKARALVSGHKIVIIQHLLPDQLEFIRALSTVGFQPDQITVVGIPYSSKRNVMDNISAWGARVEYTPYFCHFQSLVERVIDDCVLDSPFVVIEDGGYATPYLLQRAQPDLVVRRSWRGTVEQTASGIHAVQEMLDYLTAGGERQPWQPQLANIATSDLKDTNESDAVASAIVQRTIQLMSESTSGMPDLSRKVALVIGASGHIGTKVARRLESFFKDVRRFDIRTGGTLVDACDGVNVIVCCSSPPFPPALSLKDKRLINMLRNQRIVVANGASKLAAIDPRELAQFGQ